MATVKVKFRPSAEIGTPGTIQYLVSHRSLSRRINTTYFLYPREWNAQRSAVVCASKNNRRPILIAIRRQIRCDLERIHSIIHDLESGATDFSADDIAQEFKYHVTQYSLFNYMHGLIDELYKNGRIRTSETYQAALNSFRKFRNDEDIRLDFLTSETMESFAAWHKQQGNCPNTISFYNRILRAVYNRAVEEGEFEDTRPFRHVYTGVEKTKKRALPLKIIRSIKNLDLSPYPLLDYARDIFILSFLLRGMSFIDMAYMKKSDLNQGILTYRRRKTGQKLSIAWTEEMQQILNKYPGNESPYLFPILPCSNKDEYKAYQNIASSINRSLKRIARYVGVTESLTLYVARHSWASAAREKGIPMSVISEGMGHDREETTKIYLNCLATSTIDKANSLIIRSLR
ncbi:MAG: site-specific integrase [Muribaculaceae bacterium]|nr:site-specific integrase [Muribaculaceae bacterium]